MDKYTKYQHFINKLKRLKIVVFIIRIYNLRYSRCHRCGLPWNNCEHKSINTDSFSGSFATCQYCWDTSTLDEIEKCYIELYNEQEQSLFDMYNMSHTLEHLLDCVRKEYVRTRGELTIRKEKIEKLLNDKI